MKVFLRRYFAFLAIGSLLAAGSWAAAEVLQAPSQVVSNQAPVRLADRHPATLAGRMDVRQTGYVDLYAPFDATEWSRIEAAGKQVSLRR